MSTPRQAASDLLATVKAREMQRGILAEMRDDRAATARHFLAAAYLELVLASDHAEAGQADLSRHSRISAASCLWRAGRPDQARVELDALVRDFPAEAPAVQEVVRDLEQHYPAPSPA
jgi:hypothetical protein